jgi:hypothetical protein
MSKTRKDNPERKRLPELHKPKSPSEGGQGGVEAGEGGIGATDKPLSYSRENLQKVFTELTPEQADATDAMVEAFRKTMGFDTSKLVLKRGGTPGMGALGQFAGVNAQVPQFMRDSLDTAKAMAAAGKSSEEIRAVTGWFPESMTARCVGKSRMRVRPQNPLVEVVGTNAMQALREGMQSVHH